MLDNDHIKEYWENQASLHGSAHVASWGDNFMIDLEIATIGKFIKEGDVVLDVGCANGFSAFRQLELHKIKNLIGIDFSEKMINVAKVEKNKKNIGENVDFRVGDVRALNFPDATFDLVYTTRVLINLPTWQEQILGISECLRVAKPNGKVVLSEGFWEPLVLLNSLRAIAKLEPLVEHDFNRYIKKQRLEDYLTSQSLQFEAEDFSSVYYLGSRFLRELVTDVSSYPGYTNPINKIFYNIEKDFSGGGFGIQQVYIITKR